MQAWIGPAIVAAIISSVISVASWFVNYGMNVRLDRRRRDEKVRDFQIALHAEIRSELHQLESIPFKEHYRTVRSLYRASPTYWVLVPRPVGNIIFESLVKEIQLLPREVIDPVTLYNRQYQAISHLVNDMREADFRSKPQAIQIEIYADYIAMRMYLRNLAWEAIDSLQQSLARSGVSIPGADPSVRQSVLAAEADWKGETS